MTYLLLLLSAGLNAAANFTLKLLASSGVPLLTLATLKNPLLYLAVALFALNLVGYALLLSRLQLSLGYPAYVGLTFVFVLVAAFLVLHESVTPLQAAGIALILLGVLLVMR
jgi:multidrug transporter EmrE-like cation transporter